METNETKATEVVDKNKGKFPRKGTKRHKSDRFKLDDITTKLVTKLKYNADFRHYAALAIVKAVKESGLYPTDAKLYVTFSWNKFTINNDGLNTDIKYDNAWVVQAISNGINDAINAVGEILDKFVQEKEINIEKEV